MYPQYAIDNNIEGRVLLQFDLTRQGRPMNVSVVAAEPERVFDEAAIRSLEQWRYCQLHDEEPDYPGPFRTGLNFEFPK